MADDEKVKEEVVDEPTTPVVTVKPPEHIPGINMATVAEPVTTETPELDALDRELVEAEMKRGQALMKIDADFAKVADKVNAAKAEVLGERLGTEAYGTKVWGGNIVILQCLYCPLDVPANEEDRMLAHIEASHPAPRGAPTYDNLGNFIVPVVVEEEDK